MGIVPIWANKLSVRSLVSTRMPSSQIRSVPTQPTSSDDCCSLLEQVFAAMVSWTITTKYVAAASVLLVEEKTARTSTRVVGALAVPIAA